MCQHIISWLIFSILFPQLGEHIWSPACAEGAYKCMVQGNGKFMYISKQHYIQTYV